MVGETVQRAANTHVRVMQLSTVLVDKPVEIVDSVAPGS